MNAAKPLGGPGFFGKIKSKLRGVMVAGITKSKPLPVTSAVHIARAASYDEPLADILSAQFAHFRAACPLAGKRVVLILSGGNASREQLMEALGASRRR